MNNLTIRFERRFLLEDLPEPLTRASEHLQFFDNYLTETRLLLRKIRAPQTNKWSYRIVQKYLVAPPDLSQTAFAEIILSQYEYEVLAVFEGNELRYNRYFLPLTAAAGTTVTGWIDMFLNRELWNLILATAEFETAQEAKDFEPPFTGKEITDDEFFTAKKLVDANAKQIRLRMI